jgi:hypothetical protein
MNYSISGRENFLVEDPIWAEEFAPNGNYLATATQSLFFSSY